MTDVPAAISVVTTGHTAKDIVNPTDLVRAVASLQQSSSSFGSATPHSLIRGQPQQLELIKSDQSVGVYLDEVVVQRQESLNAGMFDKNQSGGAILFTSLTPKRGFAGYVNVTSGSMARRGDKAPPKLAIRETSR